MNNGLSASRSVLIITWFELYVKRIVDKSLFVILRKVSRRKGGIYEREKDRFYRVRKNGQGDGKQYSKSWLSAYGL